MPLDEVRVIAVHRAYQIRHQFPRDGVQRSAETFGSADERQGRSRHFAVALAGQERFHDRRVIVERLDGCFSGHIMPMILPI